MKKSIVKHIKCSLITAAVFMGSVSVFAYTLPSGTYYFDNTNTKWSKVYIRLGSTGWCVPYEMKKVDGNANIYSYTFTSNQDNMSGLQFASTSGYNATSDCNNDCGLYNGNVISAGNKTTYHDNGTWGVATPMYVASSSQTNGFVNMTINHACPSAVSHTVTLDSKTAGGGTIGYFLPSAKVTLSASTTLTYTSYSASNDKIHATLNYGLQGSIGSQLSLSKDGDHTKTGSVNVTLPSTPGAYTLKTYIKCVGQASSTYSSTYHVVGLTGQDLSFGSIAKDASKTLTETLSNVWNGDATCTVAAAISGTGASAFKFSSTNNQNCSIAVSSKTGSVGIVFTPTAANTDYTATLTLTLSYNGTSKNYTYTLTGRGKPTAPVVIKGAEAVITGTTTTEKATLSGYLQSLADCTNNITERGVYYKTSSFAKNEYSTATKLTDSKTNRIYTGDSWSVTTTATLSNSTTYYYRPYVKVGSDVYCSDDIYTFRTGSTYCNYDFSGDTVYVTIDSTATEDPCALVYKSFEKAIKKIKTSDFFDSNNLKYNVVFLVKPYTTNYVGKGTTTKTGGEAKTLKTILFEGINNGTSPSKVLIVRSAFASQQPSIQHPTIRNSRNIEFNNVRLVGKSGTENITYDNAVDVDVDNDDWTSLTDSNIKTNGNITFKNCYIWSQGFTCVHVSAYQNVTFENCDIEASLAPSMKSDANTICWGASVKFIQCKDIKFLRNNFRGSHTTSIWIQGVKGLLAMNNVFWNSNDSYNETYKENTCLIRLITQMTNNENKKIGIYYNTFYIADNSSVSTERHIDFFRIGRYYKYNEQLISNAEKNEISTINFWYNNCYSYDTHSVHGSNVGDENNYRWYYGTTESDWCSSINYNNFWSQYDENQNNSTSVFAIPTYACSGDRFQRYINVAELVCKTGATDPGSLVLKGGSLNVGKHITSAADVSGLGAENMYNDRLHPSNGNDAVRRTEGGWTLGAYQQSENVTPVDEIIWWGDDTSDPNNWDNRNNWRKKDGSRVTCADNFSADLKVIIPAPNSTKYKVPEGGITHYPELPNKFDPTGDRVDLKAETVNAAQGIDSRPTHFASNIEIEYGASIRNVNSLYDSNTRRYEETTNQLVAGRDEWILVGTVVRPFEDSDSKSSVRLVQSGDYFLYHWPHVYMHKAYVGEKTGETYPVNWQVPFADLDEKVDYNTVFAIQIPNQYGPNKLPAQWVGASGDETEKKTFTFNGWLLNDEIVPEYKISGPVLLCNTYPANIDVATAQTENSGSIKYYEYSTGVRNFVSYVSGTKEIKSGNGFLFVPNGSNDGWFRISNTMLTETSTIYKSAPSVNPYFIVNAYNASGAGGSTAAIVNDVLKSDAFNAETDLINTVIDNTPAQPEVYVMMYNRELDKVVVPDISQSIPLGLVCGRKMTVVFGKYEAEGIVKAVLVDTQEDKQYDITEGTASITLAKGTYTGRFYLNLSLDDETVTSIEETEGSNEPESVTNSVSISAYGSNVIITSTEGVVLQEAYITDITGHTFVVKLNNDHLNKIHLNVASGVYVIKAIGDNASRTEKVIIK